MATFQTRAPVWFSIVAVLLALWNAIGCYFCYMQFKLGADAMAGVSDYDRALYATLPTWYNYCYGIAVGAGTLGGLALLAKAKAARPLFIVSLIALLVQFGYILTQTGVVAHKGFMATVPFPVLIAAIAAYSIWLAGLAIRRGWIR